MARVFVYLFLPVTNKDFRVQSIPAEVEKPFMGEVAMSLRPAVESVRMAKQLALSTDMSRAGIKELALRLAAEGLAEQIAHGTDITPEGRMTVARALLARQLSPRC